MSFVGSRTVYEQGHYAAWKYGFPRERRHPQTKTRLETLQIIVLWIAMSNGILLNIDYLVKL